MRFSIEQRSRSSLFIDRGVPVNVATGGSVTSGNNSINQFLDQAGVTVSAGGSLIRSTNNATVHIEGGAP